MMRDIIEQFVLLRACLAVGDWNTAEQRRGNTCSRPSIWLHRAATCASSRTDHPELLDPLNERARALNLID